MVAPDVLARGQRYGFIRFGSRVDLYLPLDAVPRASVGDKVLVELSPYDLDRGRKYLAEIESKVKHIICTQLEVAPEKLEAAVREVFDERLKRRSLDRYEAGIEPMLGSLPSYTQLGKVAWAPSSSTLLGMCVAPRQITACTAPNRLSST